MPRNADVRLEWSDAVPDVRLVTDARKLTVVVRNLIGNALKFTEHGWVRAEATLDDGAVVLRVADTGIGIRAEDQEAIFEMFRQADGSDSRRYGGTGLGLYIVRRFVQQLGGTIALESAPGRGSVFHVRLPAAGDAARVAA
jgi:signal transduction histidine kinase